jgi:membrane protein DedA with SNARE-associated domain
MDITVETLLRHGTLIVFAWVFAVQVGVPIPTAPLLMAVGALGSLGKLSLGWALVGALGGSLVADLLWYGIGRRWGHWIRRTTAADRARDLFLVHRLGALVIGKFFFEVNAAVAALAGISGIRVGEFLAYDAASALLWAGAWTGLGYVLQDSMKEATTMLAPLSALLIVEVAGALAAYGAIKHARRRGVPARAAHERAPVEDRPRTAHRRDGHDACCASRRDAERCLESRGSH